MAKRILVTGASGQLGRALLRHQEIGMEGVARADLDLSHADSIARFFHNNRYDIIINCAAYTAVDKAEQDAELAYQVNARAVEQLAKISQAQDSTLIHISSDYVFNGKQYRPYHEDDAVNPINIYGKSKQRGEAAIQAVAPRGIIVRTSWLYRQSGHNFLTTMQRLGREREHLKVVFDQVGTPTCVDGLARAILTIIKHPHLQEQRAALYHYSYEGVASWYDFATAIFTLWDIDCTVEPIESKDYPTAAKRPHYSVLNKAKIKATFGLDIPHWRQGLQEIHARITP